MIRRAPAAVVALLLFVVPRARALPPRALEVQPRERLLVIAPHPDDETLGAGGLMQRVRARGGTVRVVLVTAGDGYVEAVVHETGQPRPRAAEYIAYGERRLREARRALDGLGGQTIRAEHLLGFPDGGLASLLDAHRERTQPESSPTTGAMRPPYPEAEHPDLRYDGDDLRIALVRCIEDIRPTMIAFPDPIDRHPDHGATGVFTLLAVRDVTRAPGWRGRALPRLLAYLVHWPDWPPGWEATTPAAQATNTQLELPATLPPRALTQVSFVLTPSEVTAKQRALAAYVTQQEVMPSLLAAFVRRTEPFTAFSAAALDHVGPMPGAGGYKGDHTGAASR